MIEITKIAEEKLFEAIKDNGDALTVRLYQAGVG